MNAKKHESKIVESTNSRKRLLFLFVLGGALKSSREGVFIPPGGVTSALVRKSQEGKQTHGANTQQRKAGGGVSALLHDLCAY